MAGQGVLERPLPGKNLLAMTSEGPQEQMLALDDLARQRTRKNMHYVGERAGAQLLQIVHRHKEIVVALPFCDLKQPTNAVQPRLLHLVN